MRHPKIYLEYDPNLLGRSVRLMKGDLRKCSTREDFLRVCKAWEWCRYGAKANIKSMRDGPTMFGVTKKELELQMLRHAKWCIRAYAELWGVDVSGFRIGGLSKGGGKK